MTTATITIIAAGMTIQGKLVTAMGWENNPNYACVMRDPRRQDLGRQQRDGRIYRNRNGARYHPRNEKLGKVEKR